MLRDEGGKPWQLPTCQVAGGWGEDPSRLGPTSDAIRVQIGPGDCSILPLPLLEMFHEFSIIRNFCRKQGCWGGFLYHAFSRIRIFFPETLRWLSPLIILVSFGVQLDLCSFHQCPLTWIFLDESWHPYHPSKDCCLSRQSFRTDHPCNQLNIGPSTRNPLFLHPSHSIHLVALTGTDLLLLHHGSQPS